MNAMAMGGLSRIPGTMNARFVQSWIESSRNPAFIESMVDSTLTPVRETGPLAVHFLQPLFEPDGIAVFGASDAPGSAGQRIMANLIEGGYAGRLVAINPHHDTVAGRACYSDLKAAGTAVELAVIATPARSVAGIVRQCARHGVYGAVAIGTGFAETGPAGARREADLVKTARSAGLRLIGPNSLGLMRPRVGLNATLSTNRTDAGSLALVSQSGSVCTAVLDWAEAEGIGFSAVAAVGNAADVGIGDVLDWLAVDSATRSILVYMEGVTDARRFVSALRAAARIKPVIVIKPGCHAASLAAARPHLTAPPGADDVFDAALERTGAVRVPSISRLFNAARVLSAGRRPTGSRLAIVTNAGGPAVMACDRLADLGLSLATLSDATRQALSRSLPDGAPHGNPVDVLGDADPARFSDALSRVLEDPGVDMALVMATAQAWTDAGALAEAAADRAQASKKPVFGCWMGSGRVRAARESFLARGLPQFSTPESAVEAVADLVAYRRNQHLLLQVPGPLTDRSPPELETARALIEQALADGRTLLDALESRALLSAFRIPVTRIGRAGNATEVHALARELGFPVVLKVDSPDIRHKSDVGAVRLDISTPEELEREYRAMLAEVGERCPAARILGVTVERMHTSHFGRELMIGVLRDPVFGPAISFGSGGTSVEVLRDRAVALPPLNEVIIEAMIERTRIAALLKRFADRPAIDLRALEQVLLRVSEMICLLPEIRDLDINPLIADERGLVAVDVRVTIGKNESLRRYGHMAIHPYPAELVGEFRLDDGQVLTVRPIRPEDAAIEQAFVRALSDESRYYRFMQVVHELTPQMLARFTQIDYDREMALIAVREDDQGGEQQLAVARYTVDPDPSSCEFALTVADDWQGRGIGRHLMQTLMRVARERGVRRMHGEVLAGNTHMLGLMQHLEFTIRASADDPDLKRVERMLDSTAGEASA